jgi:hypothetical protein
MENPRWYRQKRRLVGKQSPLGAIYCNYATMRLRRRSAEQAVYNIRHGQWPTAFELDGAGRLPSIDRDAGAGVEWTRAANILRHLDPS